MMQSFLLNGKNVPNQLKFVNTNEYDLAINYSKKLQFGKFESEQKLNHTFINKCK